MPVVFRTKAARTRLGWALYGAALIAVMGALGGWPGVNLACGLLALMWVCLAATFVFLRWQAKGDDA